jgi:hypothetical protein
LGRDTKTGTGDPLSLAQCSGFSPDPAGLAAEAVARARERLAVGRPEFSEALAAFLGWTPEPDLIQCWEAGRGGPPPGDVLIAAGLLAPEESGRSLWTIDSATLEAMNRREFVVGTLGLAMGTMEPWERLSLALRKSSRTDQRTVDQLELVAVGLERLEAQADPRTLTRAVTGHLDTITLLLEGPLQPSIRKQLCSIAAETAGVAGRMRWILDDEKTADHFYRVGLDAAREAGDGALGAYLMGKAACRPFYREQPDRRLRRLSGTHGFKQEDGTARTQAWLAMLEAEAHALLKNETACLRALERAESNLSRASNEERPRPRVTFFDPVWLAGQKGACLAKLGRLEQARGQLELALTSLEGSWMKQRTWLLVMLASTYVDPGPPEEACRVGKDALSAAQRVGADADLKLVRQLARDLRPWRNQPEVQEFETLVRTAAR